jgi:hypothetical protein
MIKIFKFTSLTNGRLFGSLILLLIASGCVNVGDYYGYSAEAWHALDHNQQQVAKEQYETLLAQKNAFVYGDKIENSTEEFINRNVGRHGDIEH